MRRRTRPLRAVRQTPNWRLIAHELAWAQCGQPHTPVERGALDLYDAAVRAEQSEIIARLDEAPTSDSDRGFIARGPE